MTCKDERFARIEAYCPRAGQGSLDGEPLIPSIVQSTTYCRDGIQSDPPHQYSRVSNPTVSALEVALGHLEEAPPAVAFATGLAAETAIFLAFLKAGDHVVCSEAIYGGTVRLFEQILGDLGIQASFVDTTNPDCTAAALRPTTRMVFVETPANPTLAITDLQATAALARAAGALFVVDNTFLTPLLQQPLDEGADLAIVSTTKFIEGHSAALGGSVTSRQAPLLERLRFVRKSTGAIQSPLNAWITLQGLKTLPLRLSRQSQTARALADWLATHPSVCRVHYPTHGDVESRAIAARQHLGAHGAVLSVEVVGGVAGARAVVEATELCRLAEHVGSVETLLTHSATMTHAAVSPAQRLSVGITDGLLRISVGLEPFEALQHDLKVALRGLEQRGGSCRASA